VVLYTRRAADDQRGAAVRGSLRARGVREVIVSPEVLDALTQVEASPGILAIAARPAPAAIATFHDPRALITVLDGVQDPGNVGAITRTAAAAGATGMIMVGATADLFAPKALRASAGAAFRIPSIHVETAEEAVSLLAGAGVHLWVADPRGEVGADGAVFVRPMALVFGSERAGAEPVWHDRGAALVALPMPGPVESLNVAAAAAVLLYRAAGI